MSNNRITYISPKKKGQGLTQYKFPLHQTKPQPLLSIEHPQNIPTDSLQLIRTSSRQFRELRSSRIGINDIKHGSTHLLWLRPFYSILFNLA